MSNNLSTQFQQQLDLLTDALGKLRKECEHNREQQALIFKAGIAAAELRGLIYGAGLVVPVEPLILLAGRAS